MLKRVYLEITNICNLQCAFCAPHHREPLSMTPSFFHHCLLEVKPYTQYVYLHVKGEPMLHPQFEEIMRICDTEKMQVQLVTNGTFLHKYANQLLQHPSLRKISFSLQSIEFQNGDPIERIAEILAFTKRASQQERPYCEIRFWRSDQLADAAKKQCLHYINERYEMVPTGRGKNYRIMNHVYVDFDNVFEWPDDTSCEGQARGTCHGALHQLAILSDGTVVPCCLDHDAHIPFGDLHIASMEEILQNERYIKMTEGLRNHKLTESFCRKCTFRYRFNK